MSPSPELYSTVPCMIVLHCLCKEKNKEKKGDTGRRGNKNKKTTTKKSEIRMKGRIRTKRKDISKEEREGWSGWW